MYSAPRGRHNEYQRVNSAFGETDIGRKVHDKRKHKAFDKWRKGKGLPPWVGMDDEAAREWREVEAPKDGHDVVAMEISDIEEEIEVGDVVRESVKPGLLQWCEVYCRDQALLKEFTMRKVIWGWDLASLETGMSEGCMAGLIVAIRGAISSAGYTSNHVEVTFELEEEEVIVRPASLLSWVYHHVRRRFRGVLTTGNNHDPVVDVSHCSNPDHLAPLPPSWWRALRYRYRFV